MKTYNVKICLTTFIEFEKCKAESELEAIEECRKLIFQEYSTPEEMVHDHQDIVNNLESWRDADTAEEVEE